MTFLKMRHQLSQSPTPKELEHLSGLSTIYGIRGIALEGKDLMIEYDASRIHEAEILAAVRRAGISIAPGEPIPLGGFDHTGEFKDFAWPTKGLSQVNKDLK